MNIWFIYLWLSNTYYQYFGIFMSYNIDINNGLVQKIIIAMKWQRSKDKWPKKNFKWKSLKKNDQEGMTIYWVSTIFQKMCYVFSHCLIFQNILAGIFILFSSVNKYQFDELKAWFMILSFAVGMIQKWLIHFLKLCS